MVEVQIADENSVTTILKEGRLQDMSRHVGIGNCLLPGILIRALVAAGIAFAITSGRPKTHERLVDRVRRYHGSGGTVPRHLGTNARRGGRNPRVRRARLDR